MKIYFRVALFFFSTITSSFSNDDILSGKVEELLDTINQSKGSGDQFKSLGAQVVPVVTGKLLQSLSEGASPAAASKEDFVDMPRSEINRIKTQEGLVTMQAIALNNFTLDSDVKSEAIESLFLALKSKYVLTRLLAISVVSDTIGSRAIDHLVDLLSDPSNAVRVQAAYSLKKIGDPETVELLRLPIQHRLDGCTQEQFDSEISNAREAIIKNRHRSSHGGPGQN